jgi:linoleoyl-CoA desaturase
MTPMSTTDNDVVSLVPSAEPVLPVDCRPSRTPTKKPTSPAVKFTGSDKFIRELRHRVDAYFERTGQKRRDCPQMYFKTATILLASAAAYVLLVFFAAHWYFAVPLSIACGLAIAAIGFNIQHDGGHRAYSDHQWVNRIMAMSLDLMGGSSYMWDWKHNTIHHTYPNIHGHDDDINLGFLGRLAPEQKRIPIHRIQGIYLWLLYGFLAIKWHFIDDFYQVAIGKIGDHRIPRPRGRDLVVFIAGKVVFFSMVFGIPMLFHPWYSVLACYALAAFVSGVVLAIVFQLAHCVQEADFPMPIETATGPRMQTEWAVHQIHTTVDFARGSRTLSWLLGGLNFQIEHHLFNRICHIHYPALSKVVEEACAEFGIRYVAHRTFWSALASHYHWLVEMGQAPAMEM